MSARQAKGTVVAKADAMAPMKRRWTGRKVGDVAGAQPVERGFDSAHASPY